MTYLTSSCSRFVTSMAHDKRDLDNLLAASPRIEVLAQTNDCSLAKTNIKQHFSIAAMLYPPMASDISYLEEWILAQLKKCSTSRKPPTLKLRMTSSSS